MVRTDSVRVCMYIYIYIASGAVLVWLVNGEQTHLCWVRFRMVRTDSVRVYMCII